MNIQLLEADDFDVVTSLERLSGFYNVDTALDVKEKRGVDP